MIQQIIKDISTKLDILENIPKELSIKINELDKEANDIMHTIEFSNFNAYEGWKFSNRIKELRKERRKCKDALEEMERLNSVIRGYNSLKPAIGKADKKIELLHLQQSERVYGARVISKNDDIAKLKSVNKTNIRFRENPKRDRLEELFKQIETERDTRQNKKG